jgi:hypothetical protein
MTVLRKKMDYDIYYICEFIKFHEISFEGGGERLYILKVFRKIFRRTTPSIRGTKIY